MSGLEPDDQQIMNTIITALRPLDDEGRIRIMEIVSRFYNLSPVGAQRRTSSVRTEASYGIEPEAANDSALSPKDFVVQKSPRTDTERVACLAYYLTHYRNVKHFKTIDISKLNTEAAQTKFSNTAYSVNDATKRNFLISISRGSKGLSALGEHFVEALPDREAAKDVLQRMRPRKRKRSPKKVKS